MRSRAAQEPSGEQLTEMVSTASSLIHRAHDIAKLAAEQANDAEAARTPDRDVIDAVVAAGFARHFVPRSFGGSGGTFAELKDAAVIIGAACPATAWCAVLAALMTRTAGHLPIEGQQQLWGPSPDVLVSGGVTPRGTADPVAEGWLLSGIWPLVTASDHADWALLAAMVLDGGEQTVRVFLVPQAKIRVDPTWDDVGMCATGSHTVTVDQVFVPAWMSFPFSCLTEVEAPAADEDGHAVPMLAVNSLVFCLPMLGAARGALDHWSRIISPKLVCHSGRPDAALIHLSEVYARSSSEIDAADLVLNRIVCLVDSTTNITPAEVSRNQRDCAFAADLMVGAVDRLIRSSGSSGHSTRLVLQRLWRDIHTAGAHAALQFGPAAATYARQNLVPSDSLRTSHTELRTLGDRQ